MCVQQPATAAGCDDSVATLSVPGGIVVDDATTCVRSPVTVAGVTVLDGLHWLTAGATAFARGLNDAPKVIGLGVISSATLSLSPTISFLLVALAMTGGSLLRGFKVTETLTRR